MNPYDIPVTDHDIVAFDEFKNARIKIKPMYCELGFSPHATVWGRMAVLRRLLLLLDLIPSHYGLLIWDVYRSRETQRKLFEWMRGQVRMRSPLLNDDENYNETLKYMSAPSNVGDAYCPPHLSGGAIDLTLFDVDSGLALDMGTVFDDCSALASRDFYNTKTDLSVLELGIQHRRNLLRNAMESVGFTSYAHEWWHFDIGNLFWGRELNVSPVFGPLFGDEEWPVV